MTTVSVFRTNAAVKLVHDACLYCSTVLYHLLYERCVFVVLELTNIYIYIDLAIIGTDKKMPAIHSVIHT